MKKLISLLFIFSFIPIHSSYADELIEIKDISAFNPITYIIGESSELNLPKEVTIITITNEIIQEPMIWNTSSIDLTTPGIYFLTGSIPHPERYQNLRSLKQGIRVINQYQLGLISETITPSQITFSYQDDLGTKLHHLDVSLINVWACENAQYSLDETWYNITQHSSVEVTSDRLVISHLDDLLNTNKAYRIQISYDHPSYEHYSLISRIYEKNGELQVRNELNGDRNGGKRENYVEVVIPDEKPDDDSHGTIAPDDKLPDNDSLESFLPGKLPDDSTEPILPNEKLPSIDHLNIENTESISQDHFTKSSLLTLPSTVQKRITSLTNHKQKSYDKKSIVNQKVTSVQKETAQKTVSGKDVKIQPSLNVPLYIFFTLGILFGFWTIKKRKSYEKK
ncbi:Ig-like domain-containing protein [Candidatus Stoquefichus massiliensis]|uniref:Ig-like domain-containing protein n=1 Tax=Candidatus Stoquefichus massiliensis TaxID=1470350 RepID=UPI000486B4F5|nr:Ig-like domain-containing protein [Candidatus Stoquefichus massiliensis]